MGEEGEKEREININVWLPLSYVQLGNLGHNSGMCPDWESNLWPFGLQAGTQSTELHQPGRVSSFKLDRAWRQLLMKVLQITQSVISHSRAWFGIKVLPMCWNQLKELFQNVHVWTSLPSQWIRTWGWGLAMSLLAKSLWVAIVRPCPGNTDLTGVPPLALPRMLA